MTTLTIDYETHPDVTELIASIQYCMESISLEFTEWDEPYVKGPGAYFAVVSDSEYGSYADPMGSNRWPTEQCPSVFEPTETFIETCRKIGFERDGGVVVAVDGMIEAQMVRFRDLDPDTAAQIGDIGYEDWMGSRHMSAIETSTRPEVVATITLSEETGRVSVFRSGSMETMTRAELGGPWRIPEFTE